MLRAKTKMGVTVIKTHGKVRLNRHIRSYILEYLDELHKAYYQAKRAAKTKEPLETKPQVKGKDYDSETEQGLVTVHGYLRRLFIEENEVRPETISRNQMASKLAAAVHLAAARYGPNNQDSIIGSKIVFSLSTETTKIWKEAGLDIDANLRLLVDRTFARYADASQEGAELGYAVGIHHDTDNYHAHIMLMNTDARGKPLRLSNRLEVTQPNGENTRVNFLDLLIGTANSVLRDMHRTLDTPTLRTGFAESMGNDFERWIELAALDRLPPETPKEETELWVVQEKERLREAPLAELIPTLDKAYNKRVQLFKKCQDLAQTTEGLGQLMQKEQEFKQQLGKTYELHKINRQKERKARGEVVGVMKDHAIELKLIDRLIKMGRIKSHPKLQEESIEVRKLYNELSEKKPALKRMLEERLTMLEMVSTAGPQKGRQAFDQRLETQLSLAKTRKWRDIAQRQFQDAKKAANTNAATQRSFTKSTTIREENLITLVYLFSSAQAGEIPTFLQRYQRVRKNLQTAEPPIEALAKPNTGETPEPMKRGGRGLEYTLTV